MTILPPTKFRQPAKYFGGSVLAMDINGDLTDDLLIGAPLYSDENFDEGRVFVYISEEPNSISTWVSQGLNHATITRVVVYINS